MPTAHSIASEKYVSLSTRKKNGDLVATPVWIVALPDGGVGFTTELTSGKVKRIRNFPEVTLQPSNQRGVVQPGAATVTGTATILTGADVAPVETAIKAKYGVMVAVVGVLYTIRRIVTRGTRAEGAAIRIDLG